ncbi:efflux transporter outer membrane subunit [Laribacter hongkongensis]|uniref:efflux transporter outer membrane subunit n=1 Tax=Laribacter hongkongensis TaxID=168471 RepID=UPI001EFE4542|nr:efflux transporter outer membrane subunit [Laribacter hongkongensis]MCG8991325.1 efflux transporter outer membrane subunit [Laribacter hongkongensis]MCG9000489.1 efflux transporter outer membrane subunit [Laribacter hongkongensis]MCG9006954.1 efflux transporter outer membrane subunit [Laribacter hongkongensis]MCG9015376.1 efflux transporter outer membrane subunit [Laribacter hongkongensis]
MKIGMQRAGLAGMACLLGACAVGPDYVPPRPSLPAHYAGAGQWVAVSATDPLERGDWWRVFGDAQLDRLMQQMATQSPAIAQAEAQYRAAEAELRLAQAAFWPSAGVAAARVRGVSQPGTAAATQATVTGTASWEADVWGSVRRSVESGQAQAEASAALLEAARLSAQVQLANAYLLWVVASFQQRQLQVSEQALEQALRITRNQYAAGTAGAADVELAVSQWETARAARLDKQLTVAQLEHALATASGVFRLELDLPAALPDVPVLDAGVPSTLLTRRPDIRAAEKNVAAANARIGVAQAAFFPSLTLNASVGYRGSSFAHLLTVPNRIWSIGPEVLATLLDGGARRAQVDVATANHQGAVAAYQQTVLAAFQAVEDNLSAQAILAEEENRQLAALNAARRAEQIAGNQYQAGTVGYLTVLNAQNQRIQAENALWNSRGRRYQATVGLIAGVGGQLVQPVS